MSFLYEGLPYFRLGNESFPELVGDECDVTLLRFLVSDEFLLCEGVVVLVTMLADDPVAVRPGVCVFVPVDVAAFLLVKCVLQSSAVKVCLWK